MATLSGATVGRKPWTSTMKTMSKLPAKVDAVISGFPTKTAAGRVEATYVTRGASASFEGFVFTMVEHAAFTVLGYRGRGWEGLEELFYAIDTAKVNCLAEAGINRDLLAIELGLGGPGKGAREALPLGLLPSFGEMHLQRQALTFRFSELGKAFQLGMRRYGFGGECGVNL